jgi:acetolactate synthase I/III small subunit
MNMKRTISVLMENRIPTLNRITNLLCGIGLAIESVSIAGTETSGITRMIFVVSGTDEAVEQALKQMDKLIDVIQVIEFETIGSYMREMAIIKIRQKKNNLKDLTNAVNLLNGKIIDVGKKNLTVEITGTPENIVSALNLLNSYGISEVTRSACIAVKKESSTIKNIRKIK